MRPLFQLLRRAVKPRFQVAFVGEDFPSPLPNRTLVITVDGSLALAAGMRCPCGCGDDVLLNLLADQRPTRHLTVRNGRASLSPSVWRTSRCGAHFWLRDGRVEWTADQRNQLVKDVRAWFAR